MGQRRTRLIIAAVLGFAFIVFGVAVIYWPAAIIVAGVATVMVGVLSDDGKDI